MILIDGLSNKKAIEYLEKSSNLGNERAKDYL